MCSTYVEEEANKPARPHALRGSKGLMQITGPRVISGSEEDPSVAPRKVNALFSGGFVRAHPYRLSAISGPIRLWLWRPRDPLPPLAKANPFIRARRAVRTHAGAAGYANTIAFDVAAAAARENGLDGRKDSPQDDDDDECQIAMAPSEMRQKNPRVLPIGTERALHWVIHALPLRTTHLSLSRLKSNFPVCLQFIRNVSLSLCVLGLPSFLSYAELFFRVNSRIAHGWMMMAGEDEDQSGLVQHSSCVCRKGKRGAEEAEASFFRQLTFKVKFSGTGPKRCTKELFAYYTQREREAKG